MLKRYEQLRDAIANLASSADEQATYLDRLHAASSGEAKAASYGNDELALEFDDVFHAAGHMIDTAEMTRWQRDAASPLDRMLKQLSGTENASFWTREALWSDPRWEEVRAIARRALAAFMQ